LRSNRQVEPTAASGLRSLAVPSSLRSSASAHLGRYVHSNCHRRICDGVLPTKLWENLDRKLAALEIAKGMDDQHKKLQDSDLTPAEAAKLFEDGIKIGLHDASFSETFRGNWAHNLKRYLR